MTTGIAGTSDGGGGAEEERWTADFQPRRGSIALTMPGTVRAIRVEGRIPKDVRPWLLLDDEPLFRLPLGAVWRAASAVDGAVLVCPSQPSRMGAWRVALLPHSAWLDSRWVARFLVATTEQTEHAATN